MNHADRATNMQTHAHTHSHYHPQCSGAVFYTRWRRRLCRLDHVFYKHALALRTVAVPGYGSIFSVILITDTTMSWEGTSYSNYHAQTLIATVGTEAFDTLERLAHTVDHAVLYVGSYVYMWKQFGFCAGKLFRLAVVVSALCIHDIVSTTSSFGTELCDAF